jgi:hypothetical protein
VKKKWIVAILGLGALAVLAIAALRWKDIAVYIAVERLARDPALEDRWLDADPATIEGRAIRTYYRERPGALARKILEKIRAGGKPGGPGPEDLAAVGRGRVILSMPTVLPSAVEPPGVSTVVGLFELLREDGEGGWADMALIPSGLGSRLQEIEGLEGVVAPDLRCLTYRMDVANSNSWGFKIQRGDLPFEEEEKGAGPIWTGKEYVLLRNPAGAALDPVSGRWRPIRRNPRFTNECMAAEIGDGRIITASKTGKNRFALDLYPIDADVWWPIAEIGAETFSGSSYDNDLAGAARLGDEALFLFRPLEGSRVGDSPVGLRVDATGRVWTVSAKGAPADDLMFSSVPISGVRIVVLSHGGDCAIYNGGSDRWEMLPKIPATGWLTPIVVEAGEEVAVITGEGHDPGTPATVVRVLSLAAKTWREAPIPEALRPKQFATAAWTGRELCLPGGLLDLRTGAWRPLPPGGPTHPIRPHTWTGREVLCSGGWDPPRYWLDEWALDPEAGTWRRLENYPVYRAEDAGGSSAEKAR